jgi:hypothetical protein
MFKIIYLPSGTATSQHSTRESAEKALSVVETSPPSHEILEVPDPPIDESSIIEELDLEST